MLRATRTARPDNIEIVEPATVPKTVHDPDLEKTLQRLAEPSTITRPAPKVSTDRAEFGLD